MEATRAELLHIAPWQQGLFYALAALSILALAAQIWVRVRRLAGARPPDWNPTPGRSFIRYVLGQARVQEARPKDGTPIHLLIFWGFLGLLLATTLLALAKYAPVVGLPN